MEACEGQSCSTGNGYSGKAPHGFGKKFGQGASCCSVLSWTFFLYKSHTGRSGNAYDLPVGSFHNIIGDQKTESMECQVCYMTPASGDWIRYIPARKCQPGEVLVSLSETSWSIQNQKERELIRCFTLMFFFKHCGKSQELGHVWSCLKPVRVQVSIDLCGKISEVNSALSRCPWWVQHGGRNGCLSLHSCISAVKSDDSQPANLFLSSPLVRRTQFSACSISNWQP